MFDSPPQPVHMFLQTGWDCRPSRRIYVVQRPTCMQAIVPAIVKWMDTIGST